MTQIAAFLLCDLPGFSGYFRRLDLETGSPAVTFGVRRARGDTTMPSAGFKKVLIGEHAANIGMVRDL